jgi:hypothetical protein
MYSTRHNEGSYFKNCTFNGNVPIDESPVTNSSFYIYSETFTFDNCDLGDSTFESTEYVNLVDTDAPTGFSKHSGSIFGEGSLAMIVAIVAIIAAGAAIRVSVSAKKALVVGNTDSAEEKDAAEGSAE